MDPISDYLAVEFRQKGDKPSLLITRCSGSKDPYRVELRNKRGELVIDVLDHFKGGEADRLRCISEAIEIFKAAIPAMMQIVQASSDEAKRQLKEIAPVKATE